jgi:hypothetical protein
MGLLAAGLIEKNLLEQEFPTSMCMQATYATLAGTYPATNTGKQVRIQDFLEGMGGGCSIFGVHSVLKEQKSSLRGHSLKVSRTTCGP